MLAFFIVLLIIIAIIAFKSIKVVNQSEVYIIERLGKYYKTAEAGLTFILPFIDLININYPDGDKSIQSGIDYN